MFFLIYFCAVCLVAPASLIPHLIEAKNEKKFLLQVYNSGHKLDESILVHKKLFPKFISIIPGINIVKTLTVTKFNNKIVQNLEVFPKMSNHEKILYKKQFQKDLENSSLFSKNSYDIINVFKYASLKEVVLDYDKLPICLSYKELIKLEVNSGEVIFGKVNENLIAIIGLNKKDFSFVRYKENDYEKTQYFKTIVPYNMEDKYKVYPYQKSLEDDLILLKSYNEIIREKRNKSKEIEKKSKFNRPIYECAEKEYIKEEIKSQKCIKLNTNKN